MAVSSRCQSCSKDTSSFAASNPVASVTGSAQSAFTREEAGNRQADALRCAGDQHDFAFEPSKSHDVPQRDIE
jgi:hypothetical protein